MLQAYHRDIKVSEDVRVAPGMFVFCRGAERSCELFQMFTRSWGSMPIAPLTYVIYLDFIEFLTTDKTDSIMKILYYITYLPNKKRRG